MPAVPCRRHHTHTQLCAPRGMHPSARCVRRGRGDKSTRFLPESLPESLERGPLAGGARVLSVPLVKCANPTQRRGLFPWSMEQPSSGTASRSPLEGGAQSGPAFSRPARAATFWNFPMCERPIIIPSRPRDGEGGGGVRVCHTPSWGVWPCCGLSGCLVCLPRGGKKRRPGATQEPNVMI